MITDIGMLDCSLYNPSYTVPVIDTHIKTPPRNIFLDTALLYTTRPSELLSRVIDGVGYVVTAKLTP